MADPTSVVNLTTSVNPQQVSLIIKTSEELVVGAYAAIDLDTGLCQFAEAAANILPIGYVIGNEWGINDDLTGDGTNKATIRGHEIIKKHTVTGASAITDIGKDVWATDGQTLTLTAQAAGYPIGRVHNWISTTYCDIFLYALSDQLAKSVATGSPYFLMDFGNFGTNAIQGTTAANLFTLPYYGPEMTIVSLHAQCVEFDNAASAGSQTLNLEISGTDTTGGVLTLACTNCDATADLGVAINATAITAANTVVTGDTLQLELVASGTGFTADVVAAFKIYAVCKRRGV